MKTEEFKNLTDIHVVLSEMRNKNQSALFRGQSNFEWNLTPSVFRNDSLKDNEKDIFKHWKRRAKHIIDKEMISEIDFLCIAQHTGLSTRLLDWSLNPLTALFFACSSNPDKDASFFKLDIDITNDIKTINKIDEAISIEEEFVIIQPNSSHNRIINQHGYFSIQNNSYKNFEDIKLPENNLRKFKIPADLKEDILNMLNQYGVNNLSIYPDLEGLGKHLNWFYENI